MDCGYLVKLTCDGGVELVKCEGSPSLEMLYDMIGCDVIDIVPCHYLNAMDGSDYLFVLDDNGKVNHRPPNLLATTLYAPECDFIVGDVVIGRKARFVDEEPDVYPIPMIEANKLASDLTWIIRNADSE